MRYVRYSICWTACDECTFPSASFPGLPHLKQAFDRLQFTVGILFLIMTVQMLMQLKLCITSLVPRPSASRARTAYVTFEPLSDSWQLSDKGSKVTYAVCARLADGLGTRLVYYGAGNIKG